jgi:hypothetical protein
VTSDFRKLFPSLIFLFSSLSMEIRENFHLRIFVRGKLLSSLYLIFIQTFFDQLSKLLFPSFPKESVLAHENSPMDISNYFLERNPPEIIDFVAFTSCGILKDFAQLFVNKLASRRDACVNFPSDKSICSSQMKSELGVFCIQGVFAFVDNVISHDILCGFTAFGKGKFFSLNSNLCQRE